MVTLFDEVKTVRRRQASFTQLHGAWAALSGVAMQGYEIHHGKTAPHSAIANAGDLAQPVMVDDLALQNAAGNVLGLYFHGIFEDAAVLQAFFSRCGSVQVPTFDASFNGLGDYGQHHF
mgnify:CR=1 FL=1